MPRPIDVPSAIVIRYCNTCYRYAELYCYSESPLRHALRGSVVCMMFSRREVGEEPSADCEGLLSLTPRQMRARLADHALRSGADAAFYISNATYTHDPIREARVTENYNVQGTHNTRRTNIRASRWLEEVRPNTRTALEDVRVDYVRDRRYAEAEHERHMRLARSRLPHYFTPTAPPPQPPQPPRRPIPNDDDEQSF